MPRKTASKPWARNSATPTPRSAGSRSVSRRRGPRSPPPDGRSPYAAGDSPGYRSASCPAGSGIALKTSRLSEERQVVSAGEASGARADHATRRPAAPGTRRRSIASACPGVVLPPPMLPRTSSASAVAESDSGPSSGGETLERRIDGSSILPRRHASSQGARRCARRSTRSVSEHARRGTPRQAALRRSAARNGRHRS